MVKKNVDISVRLLSNGKTIGISGWRAGLSIVLNVYGIGLLR